MINQKTIASPISTLTQIKSSFVSDGLFTKIWSYLNPKKHKTSRFNILMDKGKGPLSISYRLASTSKLPEIRGCVALLSFKYRRLINSFRKWSSDYTTKYQY